MLHILLSLLVVASAGVSAASRNPSICELVDAQLPGRVSYPGTTGYNNSQKAYFAGQERDLSPGCIFRPTNTDDVSRFVKLVGSERQCGKSPRGDRAPSPKFAVRAGGHSLWAGAANMNGGITIDLRSLNSVVVSDDGAVARIGGGAVYSSDVFPEVVKHNVTVMGGRIPGIGVGGFTTAGGMTFLSRRNGWTCDNVYGYEVVLASGEVVYATASSYPDLWLALKGGSNNFGIVTRFDVAAFPQDLMWGGVILFNYSQGVLEGHAEAFSEYMRSENFDDLAMMSIIFGFSNAGGSPTLSVSDAIFYSDGVEFPKVYENFTSMPGILPVNTLALNNVADLVNGFGAVLPQSVERIYELVFSFKTSDANLYKQLFRAWEKWTDTIADVQGVSVQYLIQPLPVSNGTNSLGLTPNAKDGVTVCITATYTNAADDAVVEKRVKAFLEGQVKILRKKDLFIPFQYLGYADKSQDPIGSYGRAIKKQLQAVSKKYDPNGLFQDGISGSFKVFA